MCGHSIYHVRYRYSDQSNSRPWSIPPKANIAQDSLQAFCSSIAGLLSSRAVLQGPSNPYSNDNPLTIDRRRRWQRRCLSNLRTTPTHPAGYIRPHRNYPIRPPCRHSPRARMQDLPPSGRCIQRRCHDPGLSVADGPGRCNAGECAKHGRRLACAVWRCWWEFQGQSECTFCEVGELG